MIWFRSHRFDRRACRIADRHYNRQKPGTNQFVPPGRCRVFLTENADSLWVSSWPLAEYTKHEWAGAWICTVFRREGPGVASEMITDAVAATRHLWGEPPSIPSIVGLVSFVTFIDREKVPPIKVRGVPTWGYSWLKAGWERIGETKVNGLLAFGLRTERMPEPRPLASRQLSIW